MAKTDLPSPDLLRQLLDYDPETGVLTWRERPREMFAQPGPWIAWNKRCAGKPVYENVQPNNYKRVRIIDAFYPIHRVVWALHHGAWPDGHIDHINGNPSDNRVANLRVTTAQGNARNMAMNTRNTSGCVGVSRDGNLWLAYIYIDRRRVYLGRHKDKAAAISARKQAERDYGFHPNHGRRAA